MSELENETPVVTVDEPKSQKMGLGDFLNPIFNSELTDRRLRIYNLVVGILVILTVVLLVLLYSSKLPCISVEDEKEFETWCKIRHLGIEGMANPRDVANTTILSNGYLLK